MISYIAHLATLFNRGKEGGKIRETIAFKWLILTLFFSLTLGEGRSQTYPLQLSVNIPPPYTNRWQDYTGPSSNGRLIVRNDSPQPVEFYVVGTILNTPQKNIGVEVTPFPIPRERFIIPPGPGSQLVLTSAQVFRSYTPNQLRGIGISEAELSRGVIPEGQYEICLMAYDPQGRPLSSPQAGCSAAFQVRWLFPPRLLSPTCNSVVNANNQAPIVFSWTPPSGAYSSANTYQYRFQLAEIPDQTDANYAINNATYLVLDTMVPTLSLMYGPGMPPLQAGKPYVWRVKAIPSDPTFALNNQGLSEICTFLYASQFSASVHYPANGDWIPFRAFPLIIAFGPYNERYRRFESNLRFDHLPGRPTFRRTLQWPNGPLQSQRDAGVPVANYQQASQIAIYPTLQTGEERLSFQRGEVVRYSGTIGIGFQTGQNLPSTSIRGQFQVGMSPSRLLFPANGDTLIAGEVRLGFQTADRPQMLVPEMLIRQSENGHSNPAAYDGEVLETWVLEVSRNERFTDIRDTLMASVGGRKRLLSLSQGGEALLQELYHEENRRLRVDSPGTWFWRVKWLKNPETIGDTTAYQYSATRHFVVKSRTSGNPVTPQPEPATPSNCQASCEQPSPTDRTAVAQLRAGDVAQAGKFSLQINEINWTNLSASGTGTVSIPFLNARLEVRFEQAGFNASKQLISGKLTGRYDAQAPNLGNSTRSFLQNLGQLSEQSINQLTGFIEQGGRLVSQLSSGRPITLPLGLNNQVGDEQFIIAIVGMEFGPERATLNAMIRLDLEGTRGWLSLGASDLCFHPGGLSGLGRAMLYNPSEKTIPLGSSTLVLKPTIFSNEQAGTITDSGTYVRWDCSGFQALQLKGEVRFGTDLILKENPDGSIASDSVVKAAFSTTVRQARQFVLKFNMDRFQSPLARGYGFEVSEAILDWSDVETPEQVQFPDNYFTQNRELWKGFSLSGLRMFFPPEFQSNDGQRLSIAAEGLLIDRNGISFDFKLRNIASPDQCQVDGWAFGIDSLNFKMVANTFRNAGLYGRFRVPISTTNISYACLISNRTGPEAGMEYAFRIGLADTLTVPLWVAKLKLNPSTSLGIKYQTGARAGFLFEANLHGNLNIEGNLHPVGPVNFPAVSFENLRIQSREPYFSCDGGGMSCIRPFFGQASPQKQVGGFPVSLDSVFLDFNQTVHPLELDQQAGPRIGLGLTISLGTEQSGSSNAGGQTGSSFRCTSTLRFRGRLERQTQGGMRWLPTGLVADSVVIAGESPAVKLNGRLVFYAGDQLYGNGFKGDLQAEVKPGFKLKAFAQFGKKEQTDYWFVDGMFTSPVGIPVGPGIAFYGFGGGAYRNMRLEGSTTLPVSQPERGDMQRSAFNYVPDLVNNTIGIRATVALGAIKKEMFYAEATLEAAISPTAGLQSISLLGNCWFFKNDAGTDNTLRGSLNFTYLPPASTFHGEVAVFVNVLGGRLKGIGPNDLAGKMTMHFSPETWFIKLGEPVQDINQRIALLFELTPQIKPRFSVYLAAGKDLPPIPEPATPALAALARTLPPPSAAFSGNADGFMLGASAELNTGPQTIADFIRYQFRVELGFDFALKNFSHVQCALASGNGSFQPGINGWYAQGQLYAGIGGSIGLKIPVLTQDFINLVDFEANFIMRGGFANPSYLDGIIQARLNILNGLIRIDDARLPFSVGDRCNMIQESPMAEVALISDLKPDHDPAGQNPVDINTNPEMMTNFPMDRPFALETIDPNGNTAIRWFRLVRERFELRKAANNTLHPTTYLPDALVPEHGTLVLSQSMDPESFYRINLLVKVQTHTASGNPYLSGFSWEDARKRDNSLINEAKVHLFKTDAFPQRIREDQVFYSYPLRNQRYFLQQECPGGFIALTQSSLADLVRRPDPRPQTTTRYFLRFIPIDGSHAPTEVPFTLGSNSYRPAPPAAPDPLPAGYVAPTSPAIRIPLIQFNLPALRNNKVYALQIIRQVSSPAGTGMSNFQFSQNLNANVQMTVRSKVLGPLATAPGETVVYQYFFKTSKFNNLREKINGLQPLPAIREQRGFLRDLVNLRFNHEEPFEEYDMLPYRFTNGSLGYQITNPPLVRMRTDLNTTWGQQFVWPSIYRLADQLIAAGLLRTTPQRLFRRLPQGTPGIPPLQSVLLNEDLSALQSPLQPTELRITQPEVRRLIAQSSLFDASLSNRINQSGRITLGGYQSQTVLTYGLPVYTQLDWASLRNAAQQIVGVYGLPEQSEFIPIPLKMPLRNLLNNQYQFMLPGSYQIHFRYVTPMGSCEEPDDRATRGSIIKTVNIQ